MSDKETNSLSENAIRSIVEAMEVAPPEISDPAEVPYVRVPSRETIEILVLQLLRQDKNLDHYRKRRAGIFNHKADYPIPAIIHALQHDLASDGTYTLLNPISQFCTVEKQYCLVPDPHQMVEELYKMRTSRFGKRASSLWRKIREESEDPPFQNRKMPYIENQRGTDHFSLKVSDSQPEIVARFCTDRFACQTAISTLEPENNTVLFDTRTNITLELISPEDKTQLVQSFTTNSPNLPATSATILSIVMGQVWL